MSKTNKISFLERFERAVNILPDPFFMFIFLALAVIFLSWLGSILNISDINPASGQEIHITNLLGKESIRRIFTDAVKNFIEFPPLGLVLVTVMGVGVAERTGMLSAYLRAMVSFVPLWMITPALVFTSVFSHIMGDACIVIMPALGALLFISVNRHPLAGIIIALVGACGGLSANIILTAIDPMLAGFTDSAAKILDKNYDVYATANYFFMFASSFLVTIVTTIINDKFIEPSLGKWTAPDSLSQSVFAAKKISKIEMKAIVYSFISLIILIAGLLFLVVPENAVLRDASNKLVPFYKSIIFLIMIFFIISGIVYGLIMENIKSTKDIAKLAAESVGLMGSYIILAFAASQFLAYFTWSNMGIIIAIKSAGFLQSIGIGGIPLLISFIIFSAILNLFITSASAKWAIMAPVFVPMMMILGFAPETTQACFRVADSSTNLITPLLPYFPIVIIAAQKYVPELTFGKLLRNLMPYSITLLIVWTIFLVIWIWLGIPLGPDTNLYYTPNFK
jgi:aminobenzoyl-glutamate transport protein